MAVLKKLTMAANKVPESQCITENQKKLVRDARRWGYMVTVTFMPTLAGNQIIDVALVTDEEETA